MTKQQYLASKMNEAVFLNCARWGYRGIVKEVSADAVLLSNPFLIFDSDSYTSKEVKEEYSIPSDLLVALDALEIVCQPVWAFYGYDETKGEK